MGKIKTILQMVALFALLYYQPLFGLPMFEIGVALLYGAAIMTLISMLDYLRAAFSEAQDERL
jgi:phosphatidylglycerophosphate synthase